MAMNVPKNTFLHITTPAAARIAASVGTDGNPLGPRGAFWRGVLNQARAADPGSQIDISILPSLGDPVADLVMTRDELEALNAAATPS